MSIKLSKGLVLHQRLDQESLKSATLFGDGTPHNNDGVSAVNPPVFAADHMGVPNRAMVFNGSNDYIDCGNDASLLFGTDEDFSISCWIKYSTPTGYQTIFGNYADSTTPGYILGITNNEKIWFRISDGVGLVDIFSTIAYDDGLWHFVVLTADRDGLASLYVDNTVVTINISSENGSTGSLNKFVGNNITNWYLDGIIEDVRVYNRLLTSEERTALYEMYRPGLSIGSLYKDLVLDMPLTSLHTKGGAAGSEIMTDLTPYSNDGQNVGATVGANYSTFNGTTDVIRIPDSVSLSPTSKMSAFAWTKGVAQAEKGILSQRDVGINQRCFSIKTPFSSPNDKLRIDLSDDGTSNIAHNKIYISSIIVFDNIWHLVGFTFGAGILKLFIDGIEDTSVSKTIDAPITTIHNSTVDITIGAYLNSDVTTSFFAGNIAKTRMWKRDLLTDEALLMYEQTKGLFL